MRLAYADDVPLLLSPEGTTCRRCDRLPGNEPRGKPVEPTEIPVLPKAREGYRRPEEQGAFHRRDRGTQRISASGVCSVKGIHSY